MKGLAIVFCNSDKSNYPSLFFISCDTISISMHIMEKHVINRKFLRGIK